MVLILRLTSFHLQIRILSITFVNKNFDKRTVLEFPVQILYLLLGYTWHGTTSLLKFQRPSHIAPLFFRVFFSVQYCTDNEYCNGSKTYVQVTKDGFQKKCHGK